MMEGRRGEPRGSFCYRRDMLGSSCLSDTRPREDAVKQTVCRRALCTGVEGGAAQGRGGSLQAQLAGVP